MLDMGARIQADQMKIARVFPRKTNMSPMDPDTYFGAPDLFTPKDYDEVHVSVVFTWDIDKGYRLARTWQSVCETVLIGGAALDAQGGDFVAGRYLKKGVTITSRGCPNRCSFCLVPNREGKLRELPIVTGNNLIDNNLLACSKNHLRKVFQMLRMQKRIDFSGGFESARINDWIIDELRNLSVYQIWLAYDQLKQEKYLIKAVNKLKKYFRRNQIRCYVLVAYEGDTIEKAEARCRRVWEIGALPFAMRYRKPAIHWADTFIYTDRTWNLFARSWTRPAAIKARMKKS